MHLTGVVPRNGTKLWLNSGRVHKCFPSTKGFKHQACFSIRPSVGQHQYKHVASSTYIKVAPLSQVLFCQMVKSYTCSNAHRQLSTTLPKTKKEKVTVTFIKKDGTRIVADGKEGDSLYDIVINNHLDIDGYGACEGTASCSTCHLIFKKGDYEKLSDTPSDEEQDLLDLAFDLTDTSRLGCMVHMTKELDGLEVSVPESINDARII